MLTFAKYQEINLGGHTTRTGFNFKYGGRLPKLNFNQEKALADLHVQELELFIPINVDSLQQDALNCIPTGLFGTL